VIHVTSAPYLPAACGPEIIAFRSGRKGQGRSADPGGLIPASGCPELRMSDAGITGEERKKHFLP